MRWITPDNQVITLETPITVDGMALRGLKDIPRERRLELGYRELQEGARPDERYYMVTAEVDFESGVESYIGTPKPLEEVQAFRIVEIKQQASTQILRVFPEWKQLNMVARGVELLLLRIVNGDWTTEEAAEVAVLTEVWIKIKALRAHSDILEAEVLALVDVPSIEAWAQHDWPSVT